MVNNPVKNCILKNHIKFIIEIQVTCVFAFKIQVRISLSRVFFPGKTNHLIRVIDTYNIGAYAVASGIFTLLGLPPAIMGSSNVVELLTEGAEDIVGGKFAVETDPVKAAEMIIEVIDDKRKGLGL